MLELLAQTTQPDPNSYHAYYMVLPILITAALTALLSLGSVYLSHRLQLDRERRLRDHDARVRVFGALMGHKAVLAQLYVSRFEALIFSDYHEKRWHLLKIRPDSLDRGSFDLEEAQRWMHKSEDLVMEAACARRDLFEAIASVRTLFPSCPELSTLTEAVYHHVVPTRANASRPSPESPGLAAWKTKAVPQLQRQVFEAVEKPIEDLIEYLAPRVSDPKLRKTKKGGLATPDTEPPAAEDKP